MQKNNMQNYMPQYGGYSQPPYSGYSSFYPQQQSQAKSTQFYFVNGIEGAKAWVLPPSTTAYLMDSDDLFFYIKSTDEYGRSAIKAYAISEIDVNEPQTKAVQIDTSNFVTKDELTALEQKLSEMFSKALGAVRSTKELLNAEILSKGDK